MRKCPEYVPAFFYGLSSLAGVFAGLAEHGTRRNWLVATIGTFVFGSGLLYGRYVQQRSEKNSKTLAIERVRQEYREQLEHLLGYHFVNILNVIAEVLMEPSIAQRRILASNARKTVVCMASELMGKTAGNGTRANLFVLNSDNTEMTLEPGAFWGRGDRSVRHFDDSHIVFRKTMRNEPHFVEEIAPDVVEAEKLAYRTYLSEPVSIVVGGGPEHIFGVLTVDCPSPKDLDHRIDGAMAGVLSTLIAATYGAL
jgi:hypothetical protein